MHLYHEPAPLRKARQIDLQKRSIFTVLATWWCGLLTGGERLLPGGAWLGRVGEACPEKPESPQVLVPSASFQQNVSSVD